MERSHGVKTAIQSLVNTFSSCGYSLSFKQIHSLIPFRIEEEKLDLIVTQMIKMNVLSQGADQRYVVNGSEHCFTNYTDRKNITQQKLNRVKIYISLLGTFSWIKTVSLTGSCALENAQKSDDVDLMIITAPHSLYICRIYALCLTLLLGFRRRRITKDVSGAVCMNIWIDGANLIIPPQKRSIYSAREMVNAQVLVDKCSMWKQLWDKNLWISQTLPNTQNLCLGLEERKVNRSGGVLKSVNKILGSLQLWYMKPHVTNEFVSWFQLWLHPQVRS